MNDLEDDLQIDLTPLIDVIFMLVIFFIMTTSFTLPVIDFNLPQASTAQTLNRNHAIRIFVDNQGIYKIDNEIISKEDIPEILKEQVVKAQAEDKDLSIELVIDAMAPTEHLIYIADMARLYTQGRLMIVSEKKDQELNNTTIKNGANNLSFTRLKNDYIALSQLNHHSINLFYLYQYQYQYKV